MAFARVLSPENEKELVAEYKDKWTVHELTIIYKVSERTVYRILAKHQVPRTDRTRIKRRKPRSKKPRELKPCGTNAAYQRHKRKGEYPCAPCLEAHSKNVMAAKVRTYVPAPNARVLWTDVQIKELKQFLDEGLTHREIGERMGRSARSITLAKMRHIDRE